MEPHARDASPAAGDVRVHPARLDLAFDLLAAIHPSTVLATGV